MFKLDEDILRAYFRLEESQRQRLWMERLLHPEKLKWVKTGSPPPITETKRIRIEELAKIGFGEAHYQFMLESEKQAMKELEGLVDQHPLWPHFERMRNFGRYLAGAFVAAGGDIQRPPTASAFWKGMGLDVLPDGTVPRRIRGKKDVTRKVPALPHVTRVGEQIRQQIVRAGGKKREPSKLREFYDRYRSIYDAKYPDRPDTFNFRAALRIAQKLLYACLWKEWREAYGLPAPMPYAFTFLRHDSGNLITIADLYDEPVSS